MKFFDLHCDTLYRAVDENKDLSENNFDVSLEKMKSFDKYVGCFAAWISDDYRGKAAFEKFKVMYDKLIESQGYGLKVCNALGDIDKTCSGAVFTVENGAALGGEISIVELLKDLGVKVMTLTWNGSNELGDGIGVEKPKGITKFGIEAVKNMEQNGIVVDLSHASEQLFYDVASVAKKPYIATHSNARRECGHKRNLTDEQILDIKSVGGIIGVNFCDYFLKDGGGAKISDVFKNIEYFLSMGCEDILCIGSDFDGAEMPSEITGIESVQKIYDYCLAENYPEELVDKIFFENAYNFFRGIF